MRAANLVALLIENDQDLANRSTAVLRNVGIQLIEVATNTLQAIGCTKQRMYHLIVGDEMPDLIPGKIEDITKEGDHRFLQNYLRGELKASNNVLVGLYSTPGFDILWRGLTEHIFKRDEFYDNPEKLKEILAKEFGIR